MMLVTSTRSPPSWAAMLPQTFSAATTFGLPPPDDPPAPETQAPRLTASRTLSPARANRDGRAMDAPFGLEITFGQDRNKSRSHCQNPTWFRSPTAADRATH